ncbi:MAG: Ig-like domain-containing protein, partial [Clostridia bacterium]|nr:Ig-like domain-containing protein [Clostridia bacterium]
MKKTFFRIFLPILIVLMLITTVSVVAIAASNEDGENLPDAMIDIRADEELEAKLLNTYSLASDGYLGVPVDFAIYHDKSFAVDPGYNGTPLIMYVVNTRATRTGTDSDVSIIKSMLDRGYIVAVADYHNHKKAVTPDLDWAVQKLNRSVLSGTFFTDSAYKKSYKESFIVPAGHNIELNRVFWEFDKHSVDGTLEKIVEIWNYDFRGMKGKLALIPWHNNGVRKEVQNGIHDNSEPVWYSIGEGEGQITRNGVTYIPDPENGLYVHIDHTKANEITDCVNLDGSPIDLNLYMHIIYPTNPENAVPVMTLASSSEHLASGCVNEVRPHTNGFGFDGYGVAMYDFAYVPMARNDHFGYFDGSSLDKGSVTGDNFTYNLFTYNSQFVPTAAMRYLRYLAATESETFKFNGTIGVIGNSKGSMITHLADKELGYIKSTADGYTEEELIKYADEYIASFDSHYYLYGHSGETRFDAGRTTYEKDGAHIDGGERQPWLVVDGAMIPSNAQFVYSSCGGMNATIDENFGPYMTTAHIGIESNGYGGNNQLINRARALDLPFLGFELYLGHTFLARESNDLGIDPYVGYKNFAHYFLNDAAPKVIYATPLSGDEISGASVFTVKFAGIIHAEEIAKATVTDSKGNIVLGVWESAYGKTEWSFKPAAPLAGGEKYTLTVPTTMKAENGKAIAEEFTATYYTESADNTTVTTTPVTVTNTSGSTVTLTVPDFGTANNRAYVYFFVSNKAANTICVYQNDENGSLLGQVPLDGVGNYAVEITSYLASMTPGETVTLYFKAGKATAIGYAAGAALTFEDFEDGTHSFRFGPQTKNELIDIGGEHGKVISIAMKSAASALVPEHRFYNQTTAFQFSSMLPTLTEMDLGRRFVLTFDVYDTTSRMFSVSTGTLSSQSTGVTEFHADMKNYTTKAGEWITVSYTFDLQDLLYGKSAYKTKSLSATLMPTGASELPIYIDNFRLEEITTDVEIGSVTLSMTTTGGSAYKAPVNAQKPYLVNGTAYASLTQAVAALGTTDGTITLQSNVTFSNSTMLTDIEAEHLTFDLGGYEIRSNAWSRSAISINTSAVKSITVTNGSIYLDGGALIGFENSSTATDVAVTLKNVYIGTELGARTTQLLVNTTASSTSKLALMLDGCTVDMRERRFTKNPVVMLPASNEKVTISTTMKDVEVYMSRLDKTTFAGSMQEIYFVKGENGYSSIMLAASRTLSEMSVITEEGFANFSPDAEATTRAGYVAYSPKADSELSTPYGIIPETYADKEAYPFVVFDRDTFAFIGASDILIQDSGAGAFNTLYSETGNYAIYLRRNFTHNNASYNISNINSDVILDLGGNTLTYNYGITPQAKKAGNHPRLTVKNGTLLANTTSAFLQTQALSQTTAFTFTFEGVTFKVAEGKAPAYLITKTATSWSADRAKPFTIDVTVKD